MRQRRERGTSPGFARGSSARPVPRTPTGPWPPRWRAHVNALLTFVAREGHARVPHRHIERTPEGVIKLGYWVAGRRRDYAADRLSQQQKRILESLPGWAWRIGAPRVRRHLAPVMLRGLRQFRKREGHCNVPRGYVEDGRPLGDWLHNRRSEKSRDVLSRELITALEAIPGFTWRLGPTPSRYPDVVMLRRLRQFRKREGHCNVPRGHVEDGDPLGNWLHHRRTAHARGRLSRDLAAVLDAIPGFTWRFSPAELSLSLRRAAQAAGEAAWLRRFNYLRLFVEREGDARVPFLHREGDYALGAAVNDLRQDYRRRRLGEKEIRALESLPGWTWDPREDDFDAGLRAAQSFLKREGYIIAPRGHMENGIDLGSWLVTLRRRKRRGTLRPQWIRACEALRGFSWNPFEDGFRRGLARAWSFAEREGHINVPRNHREAGFALGGWLDGRKQDYWKGRLTIERRRALDALPGWPRRRGMALPKARAPRESRLARTMGHSS